MVMVSDSLSSTKITKLMVNKTETKSSFPLGYIRIMGKKGIGCAILLGTTKYSKIQYLSNYCNKAGVTVCQYKSPCKKGKYITRNLLEIWWMRLFVTFGLTARNDARDLNEVPLGQ